jgi:hypothetical protein
MCLIQVKCPVSAFGFILSYDDNDDGLQIDIFIFLHLIANLQVDII